MIRTCDKFGINVRRVYQGRLITPGELFKQYGRIDDCSMMVLVDFITSAEKAGADVAEMIFLFDVAVYVRWKLSRRKSFCSFLIDTPMVTIEMLLDHFAEMTSDYKYDPNRYNRWVPGKVLLSSVLDMDKSSMP